MSPRNREAASLSVAPLSSIDSGSRYLRDIMLRDDYLHSLLVVRAHPAGGAPARQTGIAPAANLDRCRFSVPQGEALWIRLSVGDALQLIREPENRYDRQAVRIELGYVPRVQNHAVAQMLDRGEKLSARIVILETSCPPWQRIEFAIELCERFDLTKGAPRRMHHFPKCSTAANA